MRIMEWFLHQFLQEYISIIFTICLFFVVVFPLWFYYFTGSSFEYFAWIPFAIQSLYQKPLQKGKLAMMDIQPRKLCVHEVYSPNKSPPRIKFDVFISFRGSDTRRGFLSHLFKELSRAKIEVYIDKMLKEGDELSPALSRAIEESKMALVIFSKDFATSKWCLEELVEITECMLKNRQIVVPIFYKIDPSDVRHQKGCYKDAFAKHEKLFKDNMMVVEKWRTALKNVANLSGFHSTNFGTEVELIEAVTQRVLTRLNHMHQIDLKGLVGIDKPIADIESLIFCNGSKDVYVLGIWGMGGIGKTTIAGVLFNRLCSEYEGCYFLENSRKQSEGYGIIQLRDKLLSILLEDKDLNIGTNGVPDHVLRRLRRKKILVVLDDINDPNEIIDLVGGHDWLGPGSKIIVTTRDKHVICRADDIYEVKLLGYPEALQLLHWHAFNGRCLQKNWHSLMLEVVEYAEGNPLALEVLGSFLYGKSAEEWKSLLRKLKKMPHAKIQNVLRLSLEGLDRHDMSVFLYTACFFKGDDTKDKVTMLLDACGYSTSIALKTLQDRCLIIVSSYEECVSMHKLIREMGREIAREQSIGKPGDRSHLWDPMEICHFLKHDEGTKHIESITLDKSRISELSLSPHCLAKMDNLKLLRFHNNSVGMHSGLHLPEGLSKLSSNIRLFHWDRYPSKSLPEAFNAENLVELHMRRSRVRKLWDGGVQNLPNLKTINLWGSKQLVELPDLSKASSLQNLNLALCTNLVSLHPSIFSLPNVELLMLANCQKLEELPASPSSDRFHSKLQFLNLKGCESLKHLPDDMSKLTSLKLFDLSDCTKLDTSNLQIIFDGLNSLRNLYLDGCCNLNELPQNISSLSVLRVLSLGETNVKALPESIKHLSRLRYLNLSNCRRLESIPELPSSLRELTADGCTLLERECSPTPQFLQQKNTFATENNLLPCTIFIQPLPELR